MKQGLLVLNLTYKTINKNLGTRAGYPFQVLGGEQAP
jgi:hypothetical protein